MVFCNRIANEKTNELIIIGANLPVWAYVCERDRERESDLVCVKGKKSTF